MIDLLVEQRIAIEEKRLREMGEDAAADLMISLYSTMKQWESIASSLQFSLCKRQGIQCESGCTTECK